ncbi:ATP-binding cassette domain-containing protein [Mycobacterium sp. CBMA293]|uniref:sulfate/molybdate ABC transporter ATP-binding protein n=2 Tax=Mycolicibacterium TaxID=1866885 RepID=UPI0013261A71|nr:MULTISPECIES: ATP-binding cassette domain-containing protein [unclassified Mycolicibacterium]MUL49134.1 ATP-binding cassette domain-containing protein [Mycolicibacterium sp. CBMA 360]MUL97328.1 ATP-binding cassette domain-containing protein [Mycolicibacterium sp. CBMA 230]MUL62683.1 ATP-binding cassette domain-containing protein [Mycolicibacterium sp. CBMA 335]MUL71584.1 ATP-binding cassette domain-containing protein [Mycolicibacterium sp. CBMA 311]MUM07912.1 molybdenum ABC transporter ATP-
MTAGVSVRAVVAARDLDVEFAVAPGEVVAVIGPNGAGKSSLLHVIAGLLRPDSGTVTVGNHRLTDTASAIHEPVHSRRVGLLLQDPALFPHLTAAANVAFGPRARHHRWRGMRAQARQIAAHWLGEVGAADLSDRRPAQLSGGQAQRVALARALAAEPDVLLLDEPLAGLDVAAASAMRRLLRGVLAAGGRSSVLVTHDLLDVVTLADRVVVIEAGRIAESCTVADILTAPRTAFGARFAGVNLISGPAGAGGASVTAAGLDWHGTCEADVRPGSSAIAVFAPAAVSVSRDEPAGDVNVVAVGVAELDHRGSVIRVRAEATDGTDDAASGLAADISAETAAGLRLIPGERVYFSVAARDVAIRPA